MFTDPEIPSWRVVLPCALLSAWNLQVWARGGCPEVRRSEEAAQCRPVCGFCLCHQRCPHQQSAWHGANFTGFDFSIITVVFSGVVTGRLNLPHNTGVQNYHGKEGCQAACTSRCAEQQHFTSQLTAIIRLFQELGRSVGSREPTNHLST